MKEKTLLHNIKIAWRNILKYKMQSMICILGLVVGVCSFALCNSFFHYEWIKESNLTDIDKIYCLVIKSTDGEPERIVDKNIGYLLNDNFLEIEDVTFEFFPVNYGNLFSEVVDSLNEKNYLEIDFKYVDTSAIRFFNLQILSGNLKKIYDDTDSYLLTKSAAKKIYGSTNVVGQNFKYIKEYDDTSVIYKINGVIEDFPEYTSYSYYDGIVLNLDYKEFHPYPPSFKVVFKIKKNVKIKELSEKIDRYLKKQYPDFVDYTFSLSKYRDYFRSENYDNWNKPLIFSLAGLLVLFTAIFNYVLFISSRIVNRSRECAIRKVTGGNTISLFKLFGMEITILILFVFLISVLIILYLQNSWIGKSEHMQMFGFVIRYPLILSMLPKYIVSIWLLIISITFIIVFKINKSILVENIRDYHSRKERRNIFILLQLTVCMILGGWAYFLWSQNEYVYKNFGKGMSYEEKGNIYYFFMESEKLKTVAEKISQIVKSHTGVESYLHSSTPLFREYYIRKNFFWIDSDFRFDSKPRFTYVDHNYPEFTKTKMVKGRFFREDEEDGAVINETFAKLLGENPLGINLSHDHWEKKYYKIIGIIEDNVSLDYSNGVQVSPVLYLPLKEPTTSIYVKFYPNAVKDLLPILIKKRDDYILDIRSSGKVDNLIDDIEHQQSLIITYMRLSILLSLVCILICMLGIYSSMTLSVEQKTKEMAIRKINGAKMLDIARIFCWKYLKLVLLAGIISIPILFYTVSRWLENYAIRIDITVLPFLGLIIMVSLIVLITILSQLTKISRVNPVEELKDN